MALGYSETIGMGRDSDNKGQCFITKIKILNLKKFMELCEISYKFRMRNVKFLTHNGIYHW